MVGTDNTEEVLALRAEFGNGAMVIAGGTFIGILMNRHINWPQTLLSLRALPN
jgi:CO/xanthine dehydrogenase FAD-binding subunit